jgi:hypothetical protein
MKLRSSLVFLLTTLLLASVSVSGLAKGPELKFTSVVTAVTQTDPASGTVEISIRALDLPILVNSDTEIEYQSEQVGLGELSSGDLVKIRAFFSDEGMTADEIEILETRFQQFRLSGAITALDTVGADTFIVVTGVEVRADASTLIVPRNEGDALTLATLQTGDEISVNGRLEDGMLQARQLFVGSRDHGEIEFDGTVLAVAGDQVTVEVLAGVTVEVLITGNTRVRGNVTAGAYVEIEGYFDPALVLIARSLAVDNDGDQDADDDSSDDDGNGGNDANDTEIGAEITLQAVNSSLSGKAEVRFRERSGVVDQKFEVEIEDAAPGITYSMLVYFGSQSVDFGTLTTNQFGEASVEFEIDDNISDRDLAPYLPAGMDVLDIDAVEILADGVVVLTGSFSGQSSTGTDNASDDSGNGSSDDSSTDDNPGDDSSQGGSDQELENETVLSAVSSSVHGDADIRYRSRDGVVDQKLQVEIEDAPAGTTYSILVFFGGQSVDFGTFVTNSLGEAAAEYEIDDEISDRPLAPYLPAGKSVLDITTVQILHDGTVAAQGSF